MKTEKKLKNVIQALSEHEDNGSVAVLEQVGTNCPDDEVRRLTAQALVKRNTRDSLAVIISQKGKGINDLNTSVAMNTINELLSLDNKEEALKLLNEVEENSEDETLKETARSVKALMAFC